MWRKKQKRTRGKRATMVGLSRAPHWELQGYKKMPPNSLWREPAGCVFSSASPWMWTVREGNKDEAGAFVEVPIVFLGRYSDYTDWWVWNPPEGQKAHLLKQPEYRPLTDSAMSENLRELRKWSGNNTSSSLLILTAPTPGWDAFLWMEAPACLSYRGWRQQETKSPVWVSLASPFVFILPSDTPI